MDQGHFLHDVVLAHRLLGLMQSRQDGAFVGTSDRPPKPPSGVQLRQFEPPSSAAHIQSAHPDVVQAVQSMHCTPSNSHRHPTNDDTSYTVSFLLHMLTSLREATPDPRPQWGPVLTRPALVHLTSTSVDTLGRHPPNRYERRMDRACVRAAVSAGRLTGVNTVCRVLTSTTYLRRMFTTEAMAIIMGIGDEWQRHRAGQPATGAWTERRLVVSVYDAAGRVWLCEYAPRSDLTLTGQLSGQWSALCAVNGARLGSVVRFEGLKGRGEGLAVRVDIFDAA